MKDYYTILGLDPDASPQSIKLAYRRLAREAHPDRVSHMGAETEAQASARMAELNEAYSALSDAYRRKEYDEEFRKFQAGAAVEAPPPMPAPPVPEEPAEAPMRTRARPGARVISSVVGEFSTQLLNKLMNDRQTFAWRDKKFEGFEWGLSAGFWLSEYFVALRGFATADPTATQKFINYATVAIDTSRPLLKRNFYLLLMPFQRIGEPDQVQALCRRFAGGVGSGPLAGAQTLVVLLDLAHGRSLPCGPRINDKRFTGLMQGLGFARPQE